MVTYSLDQAQRDVANLRGQIAHLMAHAEFLQVLIDTSLTLPDGSVWDDTGLSVLELAEQASDPAQTSGSATLWADSRGYPRVVSGDAGDATSYWIGAAVYRITATQTINSTSFTPITGLSQDVGIGTYHFSGVFRVAQGSTGSIAGNVGFSGPAVSPADWFYFYGVNGSAMAATPPVQSTLATVNILGSAAANAEVYMHYEGTATFTAAGTFELGGIAAASHSFTVLAGTYLKIRQAT